MWTSTDFKTYKRQFDFSSSDQGKPTYTTLKIGDVEFINMVEGVELDNDEGQVFQSEICEECGFQNCEPGNWMAIRTFGDFVFFIPAFEDIANDGKEYESPLYLRTKGAYWLSNSDFSKLAEYVPAFKKLEVIDKLNKYEIVSMYKWDTPLKMFGNFPNFNEIVMNRILATSELDSESIAQIIQRKLNELNDADSFNLELISNEEVVSVYLDGNKHTEWRALCKIDDEYELLLGGKFKLTKNANVVYT